MSAFFAKIWGISSSKYLLKRLPAKRAHSKCLPAALSKETEKQAKKSSSGA